MYIPQSIYTKIALSAIKEFMETQKTEKIESMDIPKKLLTEASCFVTLKTNKNKLRGCIGTIKPLYKNLYTEIIKNAVASAVRDYRFPALTINELNNIKLSVEILYPPEKIKNISLLNPKIYGVIVSDKKGKKAVLLPNIEGIETIDEQIKIVTNKAGIIQTSLKELTLYRFKTEKYY